MRLTTYSLIMYDNIPDIPVSDVYKYITQINICLTGLFSLLFLTLKVPVKESFQGYRQTRYVMAAAYLIMAVFNMLELLEPEWGANGQLMLLNTLVLSSLQIFLLTFTLITLINPYRFTNKRLLLELTPSLVLGLISYSFLFGEHSVALSITMSLFFGYYLVQYIRYALLFWRQREKTIKVLDNYYATSLSEKRINWITVMFCWIMITGLMVFFSYLLPTVFMIPFSILYGLFYLGFGIYHLNYMFLLPEYESLITPNGAPVAPARNHHQSALTWEQLDKAVTGWETGNGYLVPGLTIEDVAVDLKTNRTYLSNYLNQTKGVTFNEWITRLRIESAKQYLIKEASLPVSQIGMIVGFPDKSNFGRQFSKVTGSSPQNWRKQQTQ